MPRKKQQTQRCVFQEGRRRCVRNGFGSPALCRAHLEVMREASTTSGHTWGADAARVVGRVIRGKRVSNDDLASGVVDFLGAVISSWKTPQTSSGTAPTFDSFPWGFPGPSPTGPAPAPGRPPPRPRPPPPPPPPPPPALDNDARRAMGFKPNQVLTEEQIKDRKRELAKKHHPDRGGSLETMQRINAAADILLAELE